MTFKEITTHLKLRPVPLSYTEGVKQKLIDFPWWFTGIILIAIITIVVVTTTPSYTEAFQFIKAGMTVTVLITLAAFACALALGLLTGLGRISENVLAKNVATFYVEVIRGVPMLVLIFFIALVGVPAIVGSVNQFGVWLTENNYGVLGSIFSAVDNKNFPMDIRAIIALSFTYGAFMAEIFRAGIQSIGIGQMEAARAQGLSYWQAMRFIILPQAIRNVLPALGNDFISMLKDSSLVSVLAVRDITQIARLYAGQTFRFPEAYTTLAVMYLTMTVVLSMIVKYIERRYRPHGRTA